MKLSAPDPQLHQYDTGRFKFADSLRDALSLNGVCLLDSEAVADKALLKVASKKIRTLRQNAMEALQSDDFQATLSAFSTHLAAEHFKGDCYFQKVPSVRLYLPGALGTSWHTDSWYGHSPHSCTFWLPLTPVPEGAGVHFIERARHC